MASGNLNLNNKKLKDEGFKCLKKKIHFSRIKDLNLSGNDITDIFLLLRFNFKSLEILNLSDNKIKDTSNISSLNIEILQKLYLESNLIEDISALPKIKVKSLREIYLSENPLNLNHPNTKEIINILEKKKYITSYKKKVGENFSYNLYTNNAY